ncbi:NAD(P)-dependent oxidoreductase [Actinoplanes sp. TBRC 11911]|uniref:NAD(P)-dependent oxidoreductase n=1 Tax=Actinoplanes sp. TBRC 11911 TaxID=2729386 RepID=UPI00145C65CF|nr:NAD(P)-dependent oxidoreductase [Actinoplanes sp. TBRC 11911]NMO55084.1 NAD(P)-dependent oxidoreductase [Actinoplanes sp. TBRC 11911]
MSETPTVAVLGTGIMGSAMARVLAKAGLNVRAWNRTRAHAQPLLADGVQVTDTADAAVDGAGVVITMLFDAAAVRDVMARVSARPGTKWLQMTTVSLADVADLAAYAESKGLIFFDAPVVGTRAPAEAGKLNVLAAGPVEHREAVAPVLDAIGARTWWQGEDAAQGGGTRFKLVANSWTIATVAAAAEALALAEGLGVDIDQFLEMTAGGPLDQGYLHTKIDLIRDGGLSPASFAVGTSEKDSRLIVEAARARGLRLDVAEAASARLGRAKEQGRKDEDLAATYYATFDK